MAAAKRFEELDVWQHGRKLVSEIYLHTQSDPFARDYGLRDQLRKAAISVISNIAEGFERGGNREFVHFLYVAKASAGEVRAQLYVALDLKYLSHLHFTALTERAESLSRQISAFIKYLEQSAYETRTRGLQKTRTAAATT